jgi:hypothetical protein
MEKMRFAITLADGKTIEAELRPEDERQLVELLGDRRTFQFTASDDDLEGHSFSGDVLVNVLSHGAVLRLPSASDAAAVRRALTVGALTATIVGAGAIAALQGPVPATITAQQAAAGEQVLNIPAMAQRAQQSEMDQQQAVYLSQVALDVDNPAVPAQALRAEQAEMQREAAYAATQATAGESAQEAAQVTTQSILLDVDNPAIPAQALRAEQAEMAHEGQAAASQANSQSVPADANNPAVPDQARRAGTQ